MSVYWNTGAMKTLNIMKHRSLLRSCRTIGRHKAGTALRISCRTDIPAMQYKVMMGMLHIFFWNNLIQILFYRFRRVSITQSKPVCHTEYMGINGHYRFMPYDIQNHVGSLSAYAGKFHQKFPGMGNFAVIPFQKLPAQRYNMLCLGPEQPDAFNIWDKSFFAQRYHFIRRISYFIQFTGSNVNAFICCLGRKNNRNQQRIR